MKKVIVAGVAASALLGGAVEAQAFEWTETKSETVRTHTEAPNCSTPGDAVADAPTWARNLEAISPLPGQHVGEASDSYEGGGAVDRGAAGAGGGFQRGH